MMFTHAVFFNSRCPNNDNGCSYFREGWNKGVLLWGVREVGGVRPWVFGSPYINNNNGQHLGWNVMCYCLHNFED